MLYCCCHCFNFVVIVVDVVVVIGVDPRDQPLKFGLNRVKNSGDIADIEFAVVGGVKSISCQTQLLLCQVELS